jgi:hypothetical protein
MFASLVRRGTVLALWPILPVLWLYLVSGDNIVKLCWSGAYFSAGSQLLSVPLHAFLRATGCVLMLASVMYHELPLFLLSFRIPLLGALDLLLAKLLGIVGFFCIVLSQFT